MRSSRVIGSASQDVKSGSTFSVPDAGECTCGGAFSLGSCPKFNVGWDTILSLRDTPIPGSDAWFLGREPGAGRARIERERKLIGRERPSMGRLPKMGTFYSIREKCARRTSGRANLARLSVRPWGPDTTTHRFAARVGLASSSSLSPFSALMPILSISAIFRLSIVAPRVSVSTLAFLALGNISPSSSLT